MTKPFIRITELLRDDDPKQIVEAAWEIYSSPTDDDPIVYSSAPTASDAEREALRAASSRQLSIGEIQREQGSWVRRG